MGKYKDQLLGKNADKVFDQDSTVKGSAGSIMERNAHSRWQGTQYEELIRFGNPDLYDVHCIVGRSRPMPFPKVAQCGRMMLSDQKMK